MTKKLKNIDASDGFKFIGLDDLVTPGTAAKLLKCPQPKVQVYLQKNDLEYVFIDGVRFLSKTNIKKFLPKLELRRKLDAALKK